MLTAITRAVSPTINRCELSFRPRQVIDVPRAVEQHRRYEACLEELGAAVISMPAEPELPDAVFVEDPAVVVEEVAVIARLGAASRRPEAGSLALVLRQFRDLRWMQAPATLEGGDVVRAGRTLFVGASGRTNAAGVEQLAEALRPFDYEVKLVPVRGCLHLKSAWSYLGENLGERTMLVNREWADCAALAGYRLVDVPADEPEAANVLIIGDAAIVADCFPGTARILERLGWRVKALDNSELMKAEAGMTCASLLFEYGGAADLR
jgi:dimethylargininase